MTGEYTCKSEESSRIALDILTFQTYIVHKLTFLQANGKEKLKQCRS